MRTCRTWILCERMHTGKPDGPDAEKDAVAVFAVCAVPGIWIGAVRLRDIIRMDRCTRRFAYERIFANIYCRKRKKPVCQHYCRGSGSHGSCTVYDHGADGQAMSWSARAGGMFALHETVERERHQIEHAEERRIKRQAEGNEWNLEISAPVFRPETALRMWGLVEDITE